MTHFCRKKRKNIENVGTCTKNLRFWGQRPKKYPTYGALVKKNQFSPAELSTQGAPKVVDFPKKHMQSTPVNKKTRKVTKKTHFLCKNGG